MNDMRILSEMIRDTAMVKPLRKGDKQYVTLQEESAPDSKITIHDLPDDAMIIKVDKFSAPDSIFNGKKGECKRADYVLISEEERCILYLEIKRTSDNETEIKKQLKGALCFVKYCSEIGKEFWGAKGFINSYKNRFIIFTHTNIPKRPTRGGKKLGVCDVPEKARKCSGTGKYWFRDIAQLKSNL